MIKTKSKAGRKILVVFVTVLTVILGSEIMAAAGANAEFFTMNNTDNYYITLASDAFQGSLNIVKMDSIAGGQVGVIANGLKIATDDPGGYRLLISSANNYSDLVQAGRVETVAPIGGSITTPTVLTANTWGYALASAESVAGNGFDASYGASFSATAKYAGLPTKTAGPEMIARTFGPNAGDVHDSLTVHYAARTSYNLPMGTYKNEIVYTAMTETTASIGDYVGYQEPQSIEIDANMIPIKYTGNTTTPEWQKADITNAGNDWFKYQDQKWANAVTVTAGTLSDYKSAPAGTVIDEADVMGYWVYIPRYRYKIQGAVAQGNISQLGELTYAKRNQTPRNFEIEFQNYDDPKFVNNKIETWLTHPAFTFGDCTSSGSHCIGGDVELPGIWMGKFETSTSANPSNASNAQAAVTNGYVYSKPNQNSLVYLTGAQAFNAGQGVRILHGLSVDSDTRMSKNSDWGAAAYLATSKFGIGTEEVFINNCNLGSYRTGWGGETVSAGATTACVVGTNDEGAYYTAQGRIASNTGNVYGMYDMSGGASDRMATTYNSGTLDRYYDNFTVTTMATCINPQCLGQALYETAGWNGNTASSFASSLSPFSARGGYATSSPGLFSSVSYNSNAGGAIGWRLTASLAVPVP